MLKKIKNKVVTLISYLPIILGLAFKYVGDTLIQSGLQIHMICKTDPGLKLIEVNTAIKQLKEAQKQVQQQLPKGKSNKLADIVRG